MTRRAWIVGLTVLIVSATGIGVLVQTYRHAPLEQTSSRTCIGCVTLFWNGSATVRANRISVDYVFAKEASYLVSFREGAVTLAGRALTPGCHEGRANAGERLALEGARDLRLRVPAPEEGCAGADGG